jgi:hypothetical protein
MAFVNGFDADKAQAYNELRQASPNLSQAQLFNQAGISAAEQGYYQPSPIGFLIQNPSPTIPSPQSAFTSEFNNPLNLRESNLSDLPQGVSESANINPNEEPTSSSYFTPNRTSNPNSGSSYNSPPTIDSEPLADEFVATSVPEGFEGGPGFDFNSVGPILQTQSQGVARDQAQFLAKQDWRFRISLAPGSTYLYNDPDARDAGHILNPLHTTQGVIFPYVPQVSVSYNASYEPTDLAHTNYRIYQYKNSSVGDINITGDFTAQDTHEANYLLAVIHFFKSVTKMFYGQDKNPIRGTPPPLCYLNGFGKYQFNYHPVAVTSFSYSLPNDVDYIKAGVLSNTGGQNIQGQIDPPKNPTGGSSIGTLFSSWFRLQNAGLSPGAKSTRPTFQRGDISEPTYVPTKIQLQIGCIPIISRSAMANDFSVKDYASGSLSVGTGRSNRGGIW